MAYENDDLRPPMPPGSSCREERGTANAPIKIRISDVVTESSDRCGNQSSAAVLQDKDDRDRPGDGAVGSETSMKICGTQATRFGDDDLRPPPPSEDVLNKRKRENRSSRTPMTSSDEAITPTAKESETSRETESTKLGLLRLCKCVCAAIAAIWLLGEFGSVFHSIAIAQSLVELLVFCGIAILELFIVLYVVYFWRRTFASLPEIKQLNRRDFKRSMFELQDRLKSGYVKRFPSKSEYAKSAGFSADAPVLRMLERLKDHKYADAVAFMEEYDRFQNELNERSSEIIKKYVTLIAIKTTASPWKIVDMISVFFNSTLMICELAKVYNRRTTRVEASRLVVRWFVNLYISGEVGKALESGSDVIASKVSDWLDQGGISALAQPVVPLLAKFGGKVVEGGVNAFLAYRLGQKACRYFRELVD